MNARLYAPRIGRFLSPDNYITDPENPQSYNRYSYVLNNPLKYVDPTGNENLEIGSGDMTALTVTTSPFAQIVNEVAGLFALLWNDGFEFSIADVFDAVLGPVKTYPSGGGDGGNAQREVAEDKKEEKEEEEKKDPEKKEENKEMGPLYAKAKSENNNTIGKNFEGETNDIGMCIWRCIAKVYKDIYNKEFPEDLNKIAEDPNHGNVWFDQWVGTPDNDSRKLPAEDAMNKYFDAKEVMFPRFDVWNSIGIPLQNGSQVIMNYRQSGMWHAVQIDYIRVNSQDSYNIHYWDSNNTDPIIRSMNSYEYRQYDDKKGGVWGWILRKK